MNANDFIPLCRPSVSETDIEAVTAVLRTGMLVQGEMVGRLEQKIQQRLGCKHAIAVANGTASLHLALLALDGAEFGGNGTADTTGDNDRSKNRRKLTRHRQRDNATDVALGAHLSELITNLHDQNRTG